LKELREKLSTTERKLVKDSMLKIERDLIGALPEMLAGVIATRSQSSLSPTIALTPKGKRGNNVKLRVSSRVRAERSAFEDEYHLTDDGQLALGFEEPPADEENEEDETEAGSPNFDDDPAPGLH
jgi:hypothetical protein